MRILLDSHIFIWAVTGEQHRLSPAQRDFYSGGADELYLSVASIWEMLIKTGLGKLTFKAPPLNSSRRKWARTASRHSPFASRT